jgi:hypothetical protein
MKLVNKSNRYKNRFLLLTCVLFLLSTSLVFATNNSSESANQTEQKDENSTIDNIKKVIQEKKTELGTVGANVRTQRAYLAKVTRVSEETLTVNNYTGNKIVPLNDEVLIQKKGKDIKVEEIVIDNWVGIYSEVTDNNLKIQKVIVYDKDFTPKNKIITIGSIADIGKNDVAINPRSEGENLHFSFSKTTKFQDYRGEEVELADFYKDLQCLIVAFADQSGNYVVSSMKALSSFDK